MKKDTPCHIFPTL